MVLPYRDLISAQVSRLDNTECKLWVKDFRHLNDRFNAPTSSLLVLHRHHHRGATMRKTLVLWDHVSVVVRVGTTLIGVQGSRPFRCQPQAQIRTSITVPATMHQLRQGRTKLVLICEPCGSRRCSSSFRCYHWYDSHQR